MPNWVKGIVTLAACYVALWVANYFLRTGDSDQWN